METCVVTKQEGGMAVKKYDIKEERGKEVSLTD